MFAPLFSQQDSVGTSPARAGEGLFSTERTFLDPRGVPVMVPSFEDVGRLEAALQGLLSMSDDGEEALSALPMCGARVVLECALGVTTMDRSRVLACGEESRRFLAEVPYLAFRELVFLNACRRWCAGDFEGAHVDFRHLLEGYPKDILALYAIHFLEFHMGWAGRMLETMAQILPFWKEDDPLYGYVKGIEAFCWEENGFFQKARTCVDAALSQDPRDIYALHAMCHIYQEQGHFHDGLLWMESCRADWEKNPGMKIHVWWHYALFLLHTLRIEDVLSVFEEKILDKNRPYGLEDLDAASLLWRLSLLGHDVGPYWGPIAQHWALHMGELSHGFSMLHALMAFVGAEQDVFVDFLMTHGLEATFPHQRDALLKAGHGLVAFGKGDYGEAVVALAAFLEGAATIGGSKAQRDVFEWTLLEAALRAGNHDTARHVLNTGRSLRFSSPLREAYLGRLSHVTA